ncbi:hypothetical protein [Parafrankia sp. EUN1f]|uniref:hypothetical protein n=1 Tax=Parafrankia sp. EUN1f TaxID=102897 RepID=UPI0001C452B1|nr:hypothetical protein [Parafrankia sp. EUN1f]EFC79071.1 hypothetical protein FrEUN1fDRAFT_7809 [Parafrankia sp. EUN1f]
MLSADGHAGAHHTTTKIVVSGGPSDEAQGRSNALGIVAGHRRRRPASLPTAFGAPPTVGEFPSGQAGQ